MSVETNTAKKQRFTFFDAVIALVIAAVVFIIAYVLIISPMKGNGASKQIEFVVEMQSSTLDVLDLIKSGDKVTISGKAEATIKNIEAVPAQKLVLNELSGEYKISPVPERYDIYATVTAPASENDKDISVGNMPIKVGAKMALEGKGYSINGAVLDMTLYNENGEAQENDN